MYLSFSLGTTLLCTTLIIYRIVTVRRSPDGISAAARAYRGIVEILVESALLYAVSLILFIVLIARGGAASAYPQIIYVTTTVRCYFVFLCSTLIVVVYEGNRAYSYRGACCVRTNTSQ